CIFWFNPLSWWLVRRLTELAEMISDDVAIAAIGDRPCYAEILLELARPVERASAGLAMARPRTVRLRIERILAATGLPMVIGWRKRASFATALIPLVAICAATITPSGSSRQAVAQDVPAAEHTPAAVDPKGFERDVGFYRADPKVLPDLVLTVPREGNHLFEQRTGANKLELFAENDHEFFHGGLDSRNDRITFVQDPQGRITGMVLHQNGIDITATRTDETEARRAT